MQIATSFVVPSRCSAYHVQPRARHLQDAKLDLAWRRSIEVIALLTRAKHLQQYKGGSNCRDHERKAHPARLPQISKSTSDERVERDEAEHDVAKPDVRKQIAQSHALPKDIRRKSAGGVCGDTDDQ